MADKSESGGGSDDPAFPCEDPTQPELEDWFKCMKDRLKKTEFLYLVRGQTPPSLIGMSVGIDLSMMRQQPAPTTGVETTDAFQNRSAWNFKCETKVREESQRSLSYADDCRCLLTNAWGWLFFDLFNGGGRKVGRVEWVLQGSFAQCACVVRLCVGN